MRFLRLAFILLSFSLEVKVHATSKNYMQPNNCLNQDSLCSIVVNESNFYFKNQQTVFHADGNSILKRTTDNTWDLINGTFWIESEKSLVINTAFGQVQGSHLNFWVVQKPNKIIYRNLSDELLKIKLKNKSEVSLPSGFQVWVGILEETSELSNGMIEPIDATEHLSLWKKLFHGSKQEFISQVEEFKQKFKDSKELSAELYQNIMMRQIASIEEKKQNELNRKMREKAQKEKVRKLYYQKVFEE